MSFLQILFYLTSFAGVISLFFVKRIDARTVFLGGTILYGLPLYFGYTRFVLSYQIRGLEYYNIITDEIYIIFILCQSIYFLSLLFNYKDHKKITLNTYLLFAMVSAFLISLFMFFYTTGIATFDSNIRSERIANYTVWYFYTGTLAVSIIVYIILGREKYRLLILPLAFLMFDLLTGDRTFIFLGIISFILAYFHGRRLPNSIIKRAKWMFSLLGIVFVAFVYKPFFFAISQGFFRVEDIAKHVERSFVGSEPFIIVGVLNEIILNKGIYLDGEYIFKSFFGQIPFFETITGLSPTKFNSIVQPYLFPHTEWGLASTAFGEVYSMGGMLLVLLFISFLFFILIIKPPQKNLLIVYYYFIIPYVLFYFHRNDWNNWIGTSKHYIFIMLLSLFIYIIIKGIFIRGKKKIYET